MNDIDHKYFIRRLIIGFESKSLVSILLILSQFIDYNLDIKQVISLLPEGLSQILKTEIGRLYTSET